VPDPTTEVFRFLGATTGLLGLAALGLIVFADPGERWTVLSYSALTLALAGGLFLIRGREARSP
jgi:hypothetical protein